MTLYSLILDAAAWILQAGGGDAPAGRAPAGGRQDQGPGWTDLLIPLVAVVAIFWFLVFRPESKQRKERERKIQALKRGDEVVTTGGIVGKVLRVEDRTVLLQVDKEKDTRLRILKSAVFDVMSDTQKAEEASREAT